MSRLLSTKGRIAAGAAAFVVLTTTALAPAAGVAGVQVHEPDRPHSADAAERWWVSCVDGLPLGAEAAERWAAECW